MANIKSAKKRILRTQKETELNNEVYVSMRTAIKKVEKSATKEEAQTAMATAIERIDNASAKGVIKANARDRYKKRLNKVVNQK